MLAELPFFEAACNGTSGSLNPVLTSIDATKVSIGQFILIGNDMEQVLACQGLNSIYIKLAHGSVCTYLPETFAWMFCTMSIILFSGMTLFTLRAALLPNMETQYDPDEDEDDLDHEKRLPHDDSNAQHPYISYDPRSNKSIRYDPKSNRSLVYDPKSNEPLKIAAPPQVIEPEEDDEDDEKYQFSMGSPTLSNEKNDDVLQNDTFEGDDTIGNDVDEENGPRPSSRINSQPQPTNYEEFINDIDTTNNNDEIEFDITTAFNDGTITENTEDVTKYENSIDGLSLNNDDDEEQSRIKEEIEVSRLPVDDTDDEEVQVSSQNLNDEIEFDIMSPPYDDETRMDNNDVGSENKPSKSQTQEDEEIEVSRLPTNDTDDVEIQISSQKQARIQTPDDGKQEIEVSRILTNDSNLVEL